MNDTQYYVNAYAGSGKTHSISQAALKEARWGEKVVIVQPTIELIKQTGKNLNNLALENNMTGVSITPIYSEGKDDNVQQKLNEYLKEQLNKKSGCILLITDSTLLRTVFWPGKINWKLYKDEVINIALKDTLNLEKKVFHLKEMCDVSPLDDEYYTVVMKNKALLEECIRLKNGVLNYFSELATNVLNPHINTICKKIEWDKLGEDKHHQINFYSIILPGIFKGFKSVTHLSAHFDLSLLYQIWKMMGVDFQIKNIKLRMSGKHNLNGRKLNIYYLSDAHWSKSLRDKLTSTDKDAIKSVWHNVCPSDFIWCANNDFDNNFFSDKKK